MLWMKSKIGKIHQRQICLTIKQTEGDRHSGPSELNNGPFNFRDQYELLLDGGENRLQFFRIFHNQKIGFLDLTLEQLNLTEANR